MTADLPLAPCPCCGGVAVLQVNFYGKDQHVEKEHYIECLTSDCGMLTPAVDMPAQAAAIWNRRSAR